MVMLRAVFQSTHNNVYKDNTDEDERIARKGQVQTGGGMGLQVQAGRGWLSALVCYGVR